MGMARQNERSANNALSDLLRGMMHGCEVRSESTRTISERSGSQPDILITAADRAPVVIEAEYMPAAEVEEDAAKRLGLEAANTGRKIEAVIALRYPQGLEFAYSLADAVAGARLSYCVLTAPEAGRRRIRPLPRIRLAGRFGCGCRRTWRALVSVPQSCGQCGSERTGGGYRQRGWRAEQHGAPCARRGARDCRPAWHVRCPADAPHGLRDYGERYGLSRPDRRFALGNLAA